MATEQSDIAELDRRWKAFLLAADVGRASLSGLAGDKLSQINPAIEQRERMIGTRRRL
jgi:hypothetical protein